MHVYIEVHKHVIIEYVERKKDFIVFSLTIFLEFNHYYIPQWLNLCTLCDC